MSDPIEISYTNMFIVCDCGHEIEVVGSVDIETLRCGACNRVGAWTPEHEYCEEGE